MNSNSDYYPIMEGDQQHTMQQGQRYGSGNRGGNFGRQPPNVGNMPRQQHPHQNQQQGQALQHQQQQQGGQPNVALRQQQMQQQQQQPFVFQPHVVFYPQTSMFRYQAPTYNPYNHTQQVHFTQQQLYNQQQATFAAAIASGNLYYPAPVAPQNPPQSHQHHNPAQYFVPPQAQLQGHYNVRGQTTVGQPQIPPPVQTQPTHQLHQPPQPPAIVAPPVVSGIVTSGSIQQPTEHRDLPPPRQKKILKIVDPNTGKRVIEGDHEREPSVSPLPTVETVELIGDNDYGSIMDCGSHEISYGSLVRAEHEAKHILKIAIPSDEPRGKTPEEVCIDPTANKAKSDFFQFITAAADEGRGRSNSTPDAVLHPPLLQPRLTSPIPSSSPTPMTLTAPAFEPLAASAPANVHIPFLQPEVALEAPLVIDPVISCLLPESEEDPQTQNLPPNLGSPDIVDDDSAELPSPQIEPVITNIANITMMEVEEAEPPGTPPRAGSGGRGDEFLDISTISISPDPIEKYIEPTPEKPPIILNIESGDPSPVGNATRESTVSPTFQVKTDDSLPSSTPNHLTDEEEEDEEKDDPEVENGIPEVEDVTEIIKAVEEITLMSIEPAQHDPTLQNGDDDLEGSADEGLDMEEGELLEEDADGGDVEEDESNEPTQKRRIVYDRSTLLNYKAIANKDALQGIDSIPPELIRDGKSPANNIGPLPRTPGGGTFNAYGNRNATMGKMNNNNRQGAYPNRNLQMNTGQWGGLGVGGMFQIPPPLPNRMAPPVTLQLKPVELHKAEQAWKPSLPSKRGDKNVDETKDEEQLLIDDIVKKTRGILNKLTPENFEKLVQKFLALKFEDKETRIGAVISVVFEKAIDEPSFSTAYAKMVHRVWQSSAITSNIFRKKILDQCQKEFQQGNTAEEALKLLEIKLAEAPADKKEAIKAEMEDKKTIARRRSLGNVRFIGELYKLGMLTPKIMVECVSRLLSSRDEESYECLCKLLTTIGQMLDVQLYDITRRVPPSKWIPEPKFMESTFLTLKSLSNDASLSSRIRFALLDVWELRDMGWKPRRDANAPKTIDEVRRAAIREEQEEKKQLMNLPPAQAQSASRSGPMTQQKKPTDWNTVPSNKSSRFAQGKNKLPGESSGDLPKFAPAGGLGWNRSGGNGSTGFGGVPKYLPPRFSRHPDLAEGPSPTPSREDIVQELPPVRTPSSHSSRESSRPQTPTKESGALPPRSQAPPPMEESNSIKEFDVAETVKNIFSEFMDQKKLDYEWLHNRFPGKRVFEFVDELSRQVCDMSKEDQQMTAGSLIKNLVRKDLVTKAQIINSLRDGVITEMPDIEVDVPKVTSYLAMFLVEVFVDEEDLSWLLELGEPLRLDFEDSWTNLVTNTINILKLRLSEEEVKGLYKETRQGANRLPIQNIPWVHGDTLESITAKMKTVLQGASAENLIALSRENSWDLREGLTIQGLAETICTLCWPGTGEWDLDLLDHWFKEIKIPPNTKLYPLLWQQAKDFMKRNNVGKQQEEFIWDVLMRHDLLIKDKAK